MVKYNCIITYYFSQNFESDIEKSHQLDIITHLWCTTLCKISVSSCDNCQMGEFDNLHNQLYKDIRNKWNWVFQNRKVIFAVFAFLLICFWSDG
uniref:Uncharacterized protein n=1 Tax=Solanum lycopersicum TaxID=4081 RepID=A0A3Q7HJ80_SOLLC